MLPPSELDSSICTIGFLQRLRFELLSLTLDSSQDL